MIWIQISLIGMLCLSVRCGIVLRCGFKNADVGHDHHFTCEASKPPLDTSQSKVIENAFGWPLDTDLADVKQFYTEHVNAINFPLNLHSIFPSLEIIRMFKSKVTYIEPMDMHHLTNLRVLDLEENELEVLQKDVFAFNTLLTKICLIRNKLKFIATQVFASTNIAVLKLEGNACVDQNVVDNEGEMTRLKRLVDDNCAAPEFLLKKNLELISKVIDCDVKLNATTAVRRESVGEENSGKLLSTCETEKFELKREKTDRTRELKSCNDALARVEREAKLASESNDEAILENVKLMKELKRANQRTAEIEGSIQQVSLNSSCSPSSSSLSPTLETTKLRYENERLRRENSVLRAFREDTERELRSVRLKCHYVSWNGIYSCQSENFKVKIDDAEISNVDGIHEPSKSNYDVRKLFIHSQGVRTLFLPLNIGATFPRVEKLFVIDSNLVSIKSENFDNMMSLKELNMNFNSIQDLPYDTFLYPQNLEKLSIAHNRIEIVHKGTFRTLTHLKYLILNDNKIQKLPAELFKYNQKLEHIALQKNDIQFIASGLLDNLHQLSVLNFENNNCISARIINFNNIDERISSNCSTALATQI